jgi:pyruvate kinase
MKIIVTLGPSTNTERDLRNIKARGVDFVRINMSHSNLDDLKYFIDLAEKVDIPFIIDTEGSQIRTGGLEGEEINLQECDDIKIFKERCDGGKREISLRPGRILSQLEAGDLLYLDFDALILRVSDVSTLAEGYIIAKAMTSGVIKENKAVVVDPALPKHFNLPVLSRKDYESIAIGLKKGVGYIAASFMRSAENVKEVRKATGGLMKVISKIECVDALENLDDIIRESDMLLVDRGDLSKEIPLEKIPFAQNIILKKARKLGKGVFIATNLLETMIWNERPTRAEVHDVITSIRDGALGVVLSAETAIGQRPMKCINMMNKLLRQAKVVSCPKKFLEAKDSVAGKLEKINYLFDQNAAPSLISPHGGRLVDRVLREPPNKTYLKSLKRIFIDLNLQMDVEQIALGAFSPLEGFMGKKDFESVLDKMRLADGNAWTIPIILDVSEKQAREINAGDTVALVAERGTVMALLHVEELYEFDKRKTSQRLYGTDSEKHPGVRWINALKPVLVGGKIDLLRRRKSETKVYELTPRQTRRIFDERGWSRVVGFHTRNVIHRSHEFIQLKALEDENCDGLFVHPVIGKKKPGDFHAKYIIQSYEQMTKHFYPRNKVVFATFSTFSRYAGPREAIFTALCRKNFGCSHFIVGRDHTGVGDFYHPKASHDIFKKFPDIGIKPVFFDKVFYSKGLGRHVHERECPHLPEEEKLHISGTEARKMFERGRRPPAWFMREEISINIVEAIKRGEEVFMGEYASSQSAGNASSIEKDED